MLSKRNEQPLRAVGGDHIVLVQNREVPEEGHAIVHTGVLGSMPRSLGAAPWTSPHMFALGKGASLSSTLSMKASAQRDEWSHCKVICHGLVPQCHESKRCSS